MNQLFTAPDTWVGGLYELVLELPERKDVCVAQALSSIWKLPGIAGCYLSREVEPEAQVQVSPSEIPHQRHVYGYAQLPNAKKCACGTYVTDFDNDGFWVSFYLPLVLWDKRIISAFILSVIGSRRLNPLSLL